MPRTPAPAARRLSAVGMVTALSAAAALAGCTTHRPEPPPPEAPVSSVAFAKDSSGPAPAVPGAKTGGRITVLMDDDFEHLDPGRSYTPDAQAANLLIQRTLTAYRRVGPGKVELVGDLATDTGHTTDNGRTWTFTLRDGLKYEDGTPITSADVAYGIARTFSKTLTDGPTWLQKWLTGNPSFNTVYKGPYDGGALLPPGVQTPDAKTITFSFPRPEPDLPHVTTMGTTTPVPRAKDTGDAYDARPLASGPYRIQSRVADTKMVLARNPYWDPKTDPLRHAYVDGYDFVMGQTDESATQRLLHENAADATAISDSSVPAASVAQVLADKSILARATAGETPYVGYLKINTQRVTDLTVRRALNCAFDRMGYIKLIGGTSIAEPATTTQARILNGARHYDAYACGPDGDPAKAKKMLGDRKPKLRYGYRVGERGQSQAAFMQATLTKAGFEIVPVPVNSKTYFPTLGSKDNGLDIYMASWSSDWPTGAAVIPPLFDGRTIGDGGNTNTSYFNDPAVNAEIDRIRGLGPQAPIGAWSDLEEKIMKEHAPLVPVYYDKTFKLNGSRVGGLYLDGLLGTTSLVNAYVK